MNTSTYRIGKHFSDDLFVITHTNTKCMHACLHACMHAWSQVVLTGSGSISLTTSSSSLKQTRESWRDVLHLRTKALLCVCLHMYVYTHTICMHACMHVCMHAHKPIERVVVQRPPFARESIAICVCILWVCIHVCMYVCMYDVPRPNMVDMKRRPPTAHQSISVCINIWKLKFASNVCTYTCMYACNIHAKAQTIGGFGEDFGFGFRLANLTTLHQKKKHSRKKNTPLDAHLRSEIRSISVNGF